MPEHIDNLNVKSKRGGARPNAGRKQGTMNPETVDKLRALEVYKERVRQNADTLFNAQFSIAVGCSFLFVVKTIISKDGKQTRMKPELITDSGTIIKYLNGDFDNNDKEYYFISTKEPDNKAIESMFDRTFGKAQQSIDLSSLGEKVGVIVLPQKNVDTLEADK